MLIRTLNKREDSIVDRRSFLASLVGGLAAASFGTAALARPQPQPVVAEPDPPEAGPQVDAEALDKTDADYAQYYYRRRRRWRRRYWRRRYYRPRYYYRRRYYRPRYYYRRRYW